MADWIVPGLAAAFIVWRIAGPLLARRKIPRLLAEGGVVVDVRGPAEYAAGARPGSLNIPLGELPARMGELDRAKPVILCCASGTRSAAAAALLRARGFRVLNAGPWRNTL